MFFWLMVDLVFKLKRSDEIREARQRCASAGGRRGTGTSSAAQRDRTKFQQAGLSWQWIWLSG
jgi:hypothetical protein